jgi:hypothetical protein
MSYYYEKTSSYLTKGGVERTLGTDVLDYSSERQQEIGLFPASSVSYDYNPYTHSLSSITWTKYDTDSDFRVANPSASDDDDTFYEFPSYFGQRNIVSLSDSAKVTTLANAKKVVFEEVADRMARVAGASLALRYNALSLSDSASTLTAKFSASDSDIFDLAYNLNEGNDSGFPVLDQDYLAATTVVADVTAGQNLDFSSLPTSDPAVAGKLWRDSDIVKVSLG